MMRIHIDEDENKPVWPTWAVGALFRDAKCLYQLSIIVTGDDDNKPIWPIWAVGALFRDARCLP
jgi:hypothetical protein